MEQRMLGLRSLEIGGGHVAHGPITRLELPAGVAGYADAQLDDYGWAGRRRDYAWRPGVHLSLRARFSHPRDYLVGTAGFGFWNAPFGDPSVRWPALPQAVWFFFASPPSDLPLAEAGPGRGWFASTLDATRPGALALAPLAPLALALNQSAVLRRRLSPVIRHQLAISFAPLEVDMTGWHNYELIWHKDVCRFTLDGVTVLETVHSPRGPLGFVCWMDNQYLVATPRGRFAWGNVPTTTAQWLEVAELAIAGTALADGRR